MPDVCFLDACLLLLRVKDPINQNCKSTFENRSHHTVMLKVGANKSTPSRRIGVVPIVPNQQYDAETHYLIEHLMKMVRGRTAICQITSEAMRSNPAQTKKIMDLFGTRQETRFGWTPVMSTEQSMSVADEIHAVAAAMALSEEPYATKVTAGTRIHLSVPGYDKVLTGSEIANMLDAKDAKDDEEKARKWGTQQLRENQMMTIQGILDNPVGPIKARGSQSFPPTPPSVSNYSSEMAQLGEVFNQDQAGSGAEWVQVASVDTTNQAAEDMREWVDCMTELSDNDEVWDDTLLSDIAMNSAPTIPCNTSEEESNTAPPTPCNTSEEEDDVEEDDDGYAGSCDDDGSADGEIVD